MPFEKGRKKTGGRKRNDNLASWQNGDLRYKLRDSQKIIYDHLRAKDRINARKTVLHCSRRFGKSYLLAVIAVEDAIKDKGCQISFICPTQKNLKTYLKPIFEQIFKDCPDYLVGEYRTNEGAYVLPNGSSIYLFGVEGGNMENLRGQSTKRAIVDEAGFTDQLRYLVDSILMPQLLTTNGTLILSSSSPLTKTHDFVHYVKQAKLENSYFKFTIDEAGYPKDLVEEFAKEMGGRDSTTFKREAMCEFVTDASRALCPEWCHSSLAKTEFIFPGLSLRDDFFQFYGKWFAMDVGARDATVGLHAYYDFRKARLVIENEFVLIGAEARTDKIANEIKAAEEYLQYNNVSRYSDSTNLILIQDLSLFHDVPVLSTQKDSLDAMVNMVRLWAKDGRIWISDRCKFLLQTLEDGTWNKLRTDFDRDTTLFHMDAFAALMYLVRMMDTSSNPIPSNYVNGEYIDPSKYHISQKPIDEKAEVWRKILNVDKIDKDEDIDG